MEHWERIQMESMTAQQWANYKQSYEYASSKWLRATTKAEATRWYRLMRDHSIARNLVAWQGIVDECLTVLMDEQEALGLTADQRDELAWELAEQTSVERCVFPPHWNSKVNCDLCGVMPCAPGRESSPCPWCPTDIGRVARECRGIE